MKFFQGKNPAVVWDKNTNKALFSFTGRYLDTSNKSLIKILRDLGYSIVKTKVSKNVDGLSTLG